MRVRIVREEGVRVEFCIAGLTKTTHPLAADEYVLAQASEN
jgi:hypothetical protein